MVDDSEESIEDIYNEIIIDEDVPAKADVAVAENVGTVTKSVSKAENKREYQRFGVSFKVFIRLSNGEITHAQAKDLSMGGIYIEYGASAETNIEFDMAFDLPLSTDFKRVFVKAKVVRSIVLGSRNMFGLAFIFSEFAKESDKVLEQYLELRTTKL